MITAMMSVRMLLLSAGFLLVIPPTSSFVVHVLPSRKQATAKKLFCGTNDNNQDQNSRSERASSCISLLVTSPEQVLLPGETARIWTDELQLVEEAIQHSFGVVALGVVLDDDDSNSDDLLEMASLCEVRDCDDDGTQDSNGIFVTLSCVGRVRLDRLEQQDPYFKFICAVVGDDTANQNDAGEGILESCNLVADNIESFMKKLSRSEQDLGLCDDDHHSLLQRYKHAYGKALATVALPRTQQRNQPSDESSASRNDATATLDLLTAISWAAFTAVDDAELNKYRLKALDWDNLFDRLKLAQYMLREKELRLQGEAMISGNCSTGDDPTTSCFSEGFQ